MHFPTLLLYQLNFKPSSVTTRLHLPTKRGLTERRNGPTGPTTLHALYRAFLHHRRCCLPSRSHFHYTPIFTQWRPERSGERGPVDQWNPVCVGRGQDPGREQPTCEYLMQRPCSAECMLRRRIRVSSRASACARRMVISYVSFHRLAASRLIASRNPDR
jgi:hypothetical protein